MKNSWKTMIVGYANFFTLVFDWMFVWGDHPDKNLVNVEQQYTLSLPAVGTLTHKSQQSQVTLQCLTSLPVAPFKWQRFKYRQFWYATESQLLTSNIFYLHLKYQMRLDISITYKIFLYFFLVLNFWYFFCVN